VDYVGQVELEIICYLQSKLYNFKILKIFIENFNIQELEVEVESY